MENNKKHNMGKHHLGAIGWDTYSLTTSDVNQVQAKFKPVHCD